MRGRLGSGFRIRVLFRVVAQYPQHIIGLDEQNLPKAVIERQAIFVRTDESCVPGPNKTQLIDS